MKTRLLLIILGCSLTIISAQNITSSWEQLNLPSDQSLRDIVFVNRDTGFITCSGDILLKTTDGGENWSVKENIPLNTIKFIDDEVGYELSGDTILMTIDCGETWSTINVPATGLSDVSFRNENVGYVVGVNDLFQKTVDGGLNWTDIRWEIREGEEILEVVEFGDLQSVNIINDTIVLFSNHVMDIQYGMTNNFFRVINDTIFEPVYNDNLFSCRDVHVVDENFACLAGYQNAEGGRDSDGGRAFKLENLASSWSGLGISYRNNYWELHSISMINASTGFACGRAIQMGPDMYHGPLVFHTTDGISWNQQFIESNKNIKRAVQADNLTAFAISGTNAYKSTEGAKSIKLELPDKVLMKCHDYYSMETQVDFSEITDATYSWDPIMNLSDPNIANPTVYGTDSIEYILTVSGGGLSISDTVTIVVTEQFAPPAISYVSIDETENKNSIVVKPNADLPAGTYKIFKETTSTDVYEEIGDIQANEELVFIDSISNPDQKSSKYKISMVDLCGVETFMSQHHKTIHLTVSTDQSGDCDLIWDSYEGFNVLKYRIWRGSQYNSLVLIDSLSGTSNSYSDQATPDGKLYYKIEALPDGDEQTGTSMSNIADNGVATFSESYLRQSISFYPNPIDDFLEVSSDIQEPISIVIIDLFGKTVMQKSMSGNDKIDLRSLTEGMYIMRITHGIHNDEYKIIKQ